jgi:transcriptional regulator GlxA family with amidase domain
MQHPLVHFGFLPLPGFSMIALTSAVEVLRMANYIGRRDDYRWSMLSASAGQVEASNGLSLPVQTPQRDDLPQIVFVCGGVDASEAAPDADANVIALLRDLAGAGVALGSLCTGAHALAAAGLLDGYRCASDWENLALLARRFPAVAFSSELFVIDRDRYTCSGGTAPLDMMLDIVAARVGPAVVADIANQFIVEHVRERGDHQRVPLAVRLASAEPALLEVVQLMEANVEEPLSLAELVRLTGSTPRQLQRMFSRQLDVSPTRYYLTLRLYKARELLRRSDLPLARITGACGFRSAQHFGKAYRQIFGVAPGAERSVSAAPPSAGR